MHSLPLSCRAAAFVLLALSAGVAPADDHLAAGKQALRQWRDAFANVRVRYTVEFLTITDPNADYKSASYTANWIWTEDHYWIYDSLSLYDEIAESRSMSGNGETESFSADYMISPHGQEFLKDLTIRDVVESTHAGGGVILPLMGLWPLHPRHAWLPDLFDELNLTYEGDVDVAGAECVEFSTLRGDGGDMMRERLALDPAHGYLPRRVVLERVQDPSENRWTFVVTEFQRTEAGTWFPARGTFDIESSEIGPSPRRWTINEVELNATYTSQDFAPPEPMDGTEVIDMRGRDVGDRLFPYVAGTGVVPDWVSGRQPEQVTLSGQALNDESQTPFIETEDDVVFVRGIDAWPEDVVEQTVTITGMLSNEQLREGDLTLSARFVRLQTYMVEGGSPVTIEEPDSTEDDPTD